MYSSWLAKLLLPMVIRESTSAYEPTDTVAPAETPAPTETPAPADTTNTPADSTAEQAQ